MRTQVAAIHEYRSGDSFVALGHGPPCDGSDWGVGYGKKAGSSKKFSEADIDVPDDQIRANMQVQDAASSACDTGITDACYFYCGEASCD